MADVGRRNFLTRAAIGAGALMLAGCDRISRSEWAPNVLKRAQGLTRSAQRVFAGPGALVPEFSKADIAPVFRPNGTLRPVGMSYAEHVRTGFSDWRIPVTGLVEQPLNLSMTDLRRIGARTQITRHDCVEGWSCIGQWTGAPLRLILARARPKPNARYVVFYCADDMNGGYGNPQYYYESLDMIEALHPQTILAYGLNGKPLPIENGAPVRLRAERQLGYKMAKYVNRIELVEEFHDIRGGQGGYWEDRGYAWWAGI